MYYEPPEWLEFRGQTLLFVQHLMSWRWDRLRERICRPGSVYPALIRRTLTQLGRLDGERPGCTHTTPNREK